MNILHNELTRLNNISCIMVINIATVRRSILYTQMDILHNKLTTNSVNSKLKNIKKSVFTDIPQN